MGQRRISGGKKITVYSDVSGIVDSKAVQVGQLKVIAQETKDINVDVARTMCDNIKAEDSSVVVILSTYADGKLNFVCACGNGNDLFRKTAGLPDCCFTG